MLRIMIYVLIFTAVFAACFMAVVSVSTRLFQRKVKREVSALFQAQGKTETQIVSAEDLKDLPACVKQWLVGAGVVGKEKIHTARLYHVGMMKTKPESAWLPFKAEYYYTIDNPGFIWHADVKAAPIVHLAGRDMLCQGKGNMLIKLFSLITVADGWGPEIDQGTLLRFLAEIVWFPTAALSPYIDWKSIDDNKAQATINVDGQSASGTFIFNDEGLPAQFEAQRYMSIDGRYSLEKWIVATSDFKEMNGIIGPASVEVAWDLPSGKFIWFKATNGTIRYNMTF
ncbi:MAG: DUF6544 family protein [Ignavibacteriales bacterium]